MRKLKLLAAAFLFSVPFLFLQACVTDPEEKVVELDSLLLDSLLHAIDSLSQIHDTVTVRDTIRDTIAQRDTLDGSWMVIRATASWQLEGNAPAYDTMNYDTVNPFAREFAIIRGGSITSVRYVDNEEDDNAYFTSLTKINDTLWIVGGVDTLTIKRAGNTLTIKSHGTYTDGEGVVAYNSTVTYVAYAGLIPPAAWSISLNVADDVAADATVISANGASTYGYVSAGDVDWFKFQAVAGRTYFISTSGQTDTYMTLYGDPEASSIDDNDDYDDDSGLNAGILWTCTVSGTYYFTVEGYSSDETGAYGVSVQRIILDEFAKKHPAAKSKAHRKSLIGKIKLPGEK